MLRAAPTGRAQDLVVFAVHDEDGHVDDLEVFGEVGFGET